MLFHVDNMSCQHCVRAVTKVVQAIDAYSEVHVDLSAKQVSVGGAPNADAVIAALGEEGYPARLLDAGG